MTERNFESNAHRTLNRRFSCSLDAFLFCILTVTNRRERNRRFVLVSKGFKFHVQTTCRQHFKLQASGMRMLNASERSYRDPRRWSTIGKLGGKKAKKGSQKLTTCHKSKKKGGKANK